MRLDKFLCDLNICSRKDAKALIKRGAVAVNGNIEKDPGSNVKEDTDIISLNGQTLKYEKYHYFMLNKPAGIVSATEDNLSKTVIDLFKDEKVNGLFPVGRLDKDTTGLLLITDDGKLGHDLTSPSKHVNKTYRVDIAHPLTPDDIKSLENGVELKDEGLTKPAKVQIISELEIFLTISEGKFHQVKRMLAAVSNEVTGLKRESMGELKLDPNLKEGCYRALTEEEVSLLKGEQK